MILANERMSHTLINCTCKNRLGFSLLPFTLISQYFKRFNWSKNSLKQRKFEDKTVKSTQPSLVVIGLHPNLFKLYGACVEAGHICSVSVFFVWVGRQFIGFCTLCFCFPTKMLHLNAPFFTLKCSVSPKKSLKCSDNAHYTNVFFKLISKFTLTKTCKCCE